MKGYLLCFILTIVFTYFAEINFKKEKKGFAIIFSIIAIFIPTFICGIRSSDVGRDIEIYVSPLLNSTKIMNFSEYINFNIKYFELGYVFYVYIISKINSGLNFLLFFIQLIPCAATFIFAYNYRKQIPMWFVMTTYLLTWYLRSYTMMRQSIAVAFILLSIITFEKKQKFKTLVLFILAVLFHKSTFVAVGLYFIIFLIDTKAINNKSKFIIMMIMSIVVSIALCFYEDLIYLLYDWGIVPTRYIDYFSNADFANETIQVSFSETLFRFVFLALGLNYCMILNKNNEKNNTFLKYFVFYLLSMGPYIISFKIINAERMNYYYYYPALLYIVPESVKIVKKDMLNKAIMTCLIVSILFVFWFFKYPIKNSCDTYPYKTDILRFLN